MRMCAAALFGCPLAALTAPGPVEDACALCLVVEVAVYARRVRITARSRRVVVELNVCASTCQASRLHYQARPAACHLWVVEMGAAQISFKTTVRVAASDLYQEGVSEIEPRKHSMGCGDNIPFGAYRSRRQRTGGSDR